MTPKKLNKNRERLLKMLNLIKKEAYSGLTCREYEMIRCTIHYIEILKEREENIK